MCRDTASATTAGATILCPLAVEEQRLWPRTDGVKYSQFSKVPEGNGEACGVYPRRRIETASAEREPPARVSHLIAVDRFWLFREYFATFRGGGK